MQMAYQGRLVDSNSAPVCGETTVDVALVVGGDERVGGVTSYIERVAVTADVNGVFTHSVGTPDAGVGMTNLNWTQGPRWLQFSANDEILLPRQPLQSVPYAMTVVIDTNSLQHTASGIAIKDTDRFSVGNIMMHHTFGEKAPIPRGWMICNGDKVVRAKYNAIHGADAFDRDGIAASPILGVFLPNLVNRYAVGTNNTTEDGSSAIGIVGNKKHTVDFSHKHRIPEHVHKIYDHDGKKKSSDIYSKEGVAINLGRAIFGDNAGGAHFAITVDNDDLKDLLVDAYTSKDIGTVDSAGASPALAAKNIQPESVQVLYIIKVR